MTPSPHKVGILGGMGPAAGTDFARTFVGACEALLRERGEPISDQAYPEHWLAQLPVPDRTRALAGEGPTPLHGLIKALQQLSAVGARTVAMACNTAHAWHEELQHHCPELELLHIVRETTLQLAIDGVRSVGLMATLGTHRSGLYERVLTHAGIRCHVPNADGQLRVMRGITEGVKGGNLPLAHECFERVAGELVQRHGVRTLLLACTEIPLVLKDLPAHPAVRLVDPAAILARVLAERAYATHAALV